MKKVGEHNGDLQMLHLLLKLKQRAEPLLIEDLSGGEMGTKPCLRKTLMRGHCVALLDKNPQDAFIKQFPLSALVCAPRQNKSTLTPTCKIKPDTIGSFVMRECSIMPQTHEFAHVLVLQECTMKVQEGKFKLQDLLVVPMQRVLKYHLLLKVGPHVLKNNNVSREFIIRVLCYKINSNS